MDHRKLKENIERAFFGENDSWFDEVFKIIHCMSRPRVYAILNAIVASMDPEELYLEVGTFQGGSLIAALMKNNASAIGVDSFGEFQETNSLERTVNNLVEFGVAPRVKMMNMGYKEFFAQVDPQINIGVYYYDGAHDYETQLAGMDAAWPFLKPGAIVIVDDLTYIEVTRAVNQFISNHIENLKIKFVILPDQNTDNIWWNGVCVLQVT